TLRAASVRPAEEPEALAPGTSAGALLPAARGTEEGPVSPSWALVLRQRTPSAQAVAGPSAAEAPRLAHEALRGEALARPAHAAADLLFARARSASGPHSLFALRTSPADADLLNFFANGF